MEQPDHQFPAVTRRSLLAGGAGALGIGLLARSATAQTVSAGSRLQAQEPCRLRTN